MTCTNVPFISGASLSIWIGKQIFHICCEIDVSDYWLSAKLPSLIGHNYKLIESTAFGPICSIIRLLREICTNVKAAVTRIKGGQIID